MFATKFGLQSDDYKICVVMVGLPARGKSLIAGKGEMTLRSLDHFLLHRSSSNLLT